MNKAELNFFPYIFFMIGLMLQLIINELDNFLVETGVWMIFMELYFLTLMWFNYEVDKI